MLELTAEWTNNKVEYKTEEYPPRLEGMSLLKNFMFRIVFEINNKMNICNNIQKQFLYWMEQVYENGSVEIKGNGYYISIEEVRTPGLHEHLGHDKMSDGFDEGVMSGEE